MQVSRTHHADQAAQLSDLIGLKFANARFGTTIKRLLKVSEPDGPSTDGGRKARQSIVLAPEDEGASGAVVCGWLDVAKRTAELKSYAVLAQTYRERYGVDLDLSRGEHHRMQQALIEFLRGLVIDVRMSNIPRKTTVIPGTEPPQVPVAPPRGWGEVLALVAGGMLFGFLSCYLLFASHILH